MPHIEGTPYFKIFRYLFKYTCCSGCKSFNMVRCSCNRFNTISMPHLGGCWYSKRDEILPKTESEIYTFLDDALNVSIPLLNKNQIKKIINWIKLGPGIYYENEVEEAEVDNILEFFLFSKIQHFPRMKQAYALLYVLSKLRKYLREKNGI